MFCKTCKLANLQNLQIDPWDMLNNFCFHVYAQKSLFIGENDNVYFWTAAAAAAPSPVSFEFIELGFPAKNVKIVIRNLLVR